MWYVLQVPQHTMYGPSHALSEPFWAVTATRIAVAAQHGSNGKREGQLTRHIVAPAIFTALFPLANVSGQGGRDITGMEGGNRERLQEQEPRHNHEETGVSGRLQGWFGGR